jgi:hypothetical protein
VVLHRLRGEESRYGQVLRGLREEEVKLLFNGGGRALPCTRQEPFAKGSWISKNLKKHYPINTFLKVLGILKGLAIFAEGKFAPSVSEEIFKSPLSGSRRACSACSALADKPKFEIKRMKQNNIKGETSWQSSQKRPPWALTPGTPLAPTSASRWYWK